MMVGQSQGGRKLTGEGGWWGQWSRREPLRPLLAASGCKITPIASGVVERRGVHRRPEGALRVAQRRFIPERHVDRPYQSLIGVTFDTFDRVPTFRSQPATSTKFPCCISLGATPPRGGLRSYVRNRNYIHKCDQLFVRLAFRNCDAMSALMADFLSGRHATHPRTYHRDARVGLRTAYVSRQAWNSATAFPSYSSSP